MIELLLKRRSIRKYKNKKIEKESLDKILQAALLSPSSRGINPWEFVVVENESIIEELAKSKKHGSSFLENAPLVIAIIADNKKSDVCIEDASIAATIIQLQVETMGLGSCWVQIRNRYTKDNILSEDYVRKVLEIPSDYLVEALIGIGYKDEDKEPYTLDNLDYSKIHYKR